MSGGPSKTLWVIIEKEREFQKNIYFCFIDYTKAFDCVDHNKLWKILQEMGTPHHLTCLLRNLYAGQEAIVRSAHGTTDCFQIRKGVHQGCMLSPCLFNLYALGVGDGQGGMACCDSWGCKESDMTERLNWTELNWIEQRVHHEKCWAEWSTSCSQECQEKYQ